MNERCQNCGAEIAAGQQFCRRCGTPVGRGGAGEEAPTRILPHDSQTTGVPANATSPLSARRTDPVGGQQPPGFQPPYRPGFPAAPAAPMARAASRRVWLVALVGLIACAGLGTLLFVASSLTRDGKVTVKKISAPKAPGAPTQPGASKAPGAPEAPAPPDLPGTEAGGEVLGEEGATVTGQETVITRTFPLDDDATFSVKNDDGDISVVGWDEPRAEVKVVKRGGSADERRNARVVFKRDEAELSLSAAAATSGPVDVRYEVKLPRNLHELQLTGAKTDVRAANFEGSLVVDVQTGSIVLEDVTGETRTRIIKGDTKIVFRKAARGGSQEFTSVRGDVEVQFAAASNIDLKAETVDGDIEADGALGLRVEKRFAGHRAVGRLGEGGDPILIKVVNGNIKLKK